MAGGSRRPPVMDYIVDTTVLSNFAAIGQLDLLRQLFGVVHLSTEVYAEIRAGLEEGYRFYGAVIGVVHPLTSEGWLRLVGMRDGEFSLFAEAPSRLHAGEAASLAIARARGWLLLTDDRAARAEARRIGVTISGTLGCLLLAVERHQCRVEQANEWLREMISQGYRSPVADLNALLPKPD